MAFREDIVIVEKTSYKETLVISRLQTFFTWAGYDCRVCKATINVPLLYEEAVYWECNCNPLKEHAFLLEKCSPFKTHPNPDFGPNHEVLEKVAKELWKSQC